MRYPFTITRESNGKLRVRRWTFEASLVVHDDKLRIKLTLVSYTDGMRETPRKRTMKFTDRRLWAFKNIRVPDRPGAWDRVERWNNMTRAYDMNDTRSADPCDPPPLPDDVREEALTRARLGISLVIPENPTTA